MRSKLTEVVSSKDRLPEHLAQDLLLIVKTDDTFLQQRNALIKAFQKIYFDSFWLAPVLIDSQIQHDTNKYKSTNNHFSHSFHSFIHSFIHSEIYLFIIYLFIHSRSLEVLNNFDFH